MDGSPEPSQQRPEFDSQHLCSGPIIGSRLDAEDGVLSVHSEAGHHRRPRTPDRPERGP